MEKPPANAEKGSGLRLASSILACVVWGFLFLVPLIGLILLFLKNKSEADSR
jgi:hypothetical protein